MEVTPESPGVVSSPPSALDSLELDGPLPIHDDAPNPPSEAGDNSRKQQQQQQQRVYSNYCVTMIVGDGRCLFRSVAHGACLRFDTGFWSAKPPRQIEHEQRVMADMLREEAVDELVRRREEAEWFIAGNFTAYVRRMRQPHTFGGEPELAMLSHVLQHPITVYMARMENEHGGGGGGGGGVTVVAKYGEEEYGTTVDTGVKNVPIRVLYHPARRHYEALQVFPRRRRRPPTSDHTPIIIRAKSCG